MARLCWKCETDGDPLWKALADLRAKIRDLEIQRGEKTENMNLNTCNHSTNDNNNSQNPYIFPMSNHCAVNISVDDHQDPVCSKATNNDIEEITCEMEKNLASDALKMAEKRCTLLENQLAAMKRLFLRKLAKKTEPETIRSINDIDVIRHAKKNSLKNTLIEAKAIVDTESSQSFNLETLENLSSGTESESCNLEFEDGYLKGIQKNNYLTVLENSYKEKNKNFGFVKSIKRQGSFRTETIFK